MRDGPDIVQIAALIGDHARAEMLTALMADRALTPTELAKIAGVTKQTLSAHLGKLRAAGLVTVEPHGRHRYVRLAGPDVAALLESLMGVAFRTGAVRAYASPREPALRKARVCYDHLAGEVAVQLYEALRSTEALQTTMGGLELTPQGRSQLSALGIDAEAWQGKKRAGCRPCVDWSERRHHLAGALGAALLARFLELGWARRAQDSRVVTFSPEGEAQLRTFFRLPAPA